MLQYSTVQYWIIAVTYLNVSVSTSKLYLNEFYSCYELDREARTKSAKYLRNCFESKSRILVVNSKAVSVGQFWEGRKTLMKNVYAS